MNIGCGQKKHARNPVRRAMNVNIGGLHLFTHSAADSYDVVVGAAINAITMVIGIVALIPPNSVFALHAVACPFHTDGSLLRAAHNRYLVDSDVDNVRKNGLLSLTSNVYCVHVYCIHSIHAVRSAPQAMCLSEKSAICNSINYNASHIYKCHTTTGAQLLLALHI